MIQKNIDFDTATRMMSALDADPKETLVPLEHALGRILSKDFRASFPMPPFDKSPFDGFAVSSSDLPNTFPIAFTVAAGDQQVPDLIAGNAVRIFTGAPVPRGADVIIKQEDTIYTSEQVTVPSSFPPGTNIIRRGETFAPGQLLIQRGQTLSASLLGVLASQGIASVPVFERPKVSIISTGSELAAPGDPCSPYGIYNSSYYTIRGYLEKMGFYVSPIQIVPDDPEIIASAVREKMDSDADLVITTGGASVGDYDFALQTAETIGADILFWKVRMKPGGALLASQKGNKVLLGLSGNPAAAVMCLLTITQPYLRKLTGSCAGNQELRMPLYRDMPKTSSAARMLRGHMRLDGNLAFFEENSGQRNGDILSFHNTELIAVIPANSPPLHAEETVRVIQLSNDLM